MSPRRIERSIRGLKSVTDQYGVQGWPVVLLHGIPGHRRNFARVAHILSRYGAVSYVPDLPGYGESEGPAIAWHAAQQAAWLIEYMDAMQLSRVHVVGFDFGGPIAVTAISEAPGRFASLVLANSNLLADTPIPLPMRIGLLSLVGEVAFRGLFGRTGLAMLWLAAVAKKREFRFAAFRAMLRSEQGLRSLRQVMLMSFRQLRELYSPVEDALRALRLPTIVLWAGRDPFFPSDMGRRIATQVAGAQLRALPDVGHFVPEEDPDAVALAVLEARSVAVDIAAVTE